MGLGKIFLIIGLIVLASSASLFLFRLVSDVHLDDVSPEISCSAELLEKADVLYVIPKFQNKSISENMEWCGRILSLNKTLGLHGVYHTYNEFAVDRSAEYLDEGVRIFEECFGSKPERFKAPQVNLSEHNRKMIEEKMKVDGMIDHLFHKVYHCDDTGLHANSLIDIF